MKMHDSELYKEAKLVVRDDHVCELAHNKNVVHIGCADAPFTRERLENGGLLHSRLMNSASEIVGVDIDDTCLSTLKRHLPGRYLSQDVYQLHPNDIGFQPSLIVWTDVIEHLTNPGLAIDAIGQIARKGTLLVATAPNAFSLKAFLRLVTKVERIHPDHMAYYSAHTMANTFEKHGWAMQSVFVSPSGGTSRMANLVNRTFLPKFPQYADTVGLVLQRL